MKFFGLFLNPCNGSLNLFYATLFIFGLDLASCSDILPPNEWPVTIILSLPYLLFTLFKCSCDCLNLLFCFSNPKNTAVSALRSLNIFLSLKLVPLFDITVSLLIGLWKTFCNFVDKSGSYL